MSMIILFIIWIVLGLAIGYAAANIFKGPRPYGLNGDLIIAILAMIAIGLGDWYVIPMILSNMARLWVFAAALVEPAIGALIVLWAVRYFKK